MSIRVLIMLNRKPGMSPEEFRHEYENGHVKLALRLFGHLWKEYRRNYMGAANSFANVKGAPTEGANADTPTPPYDVIAELVFEDLAAIEEMNRLVAQNWELLAKDEDRLFDRPNCWLVMCDTLEEDLRPFATG